MAKMCAERKNKESNAHVVWYETWGVGVIFTYLYLCVCVYTSSFSYVIKLTVVEKIKGP